MASQRPMRRQLQQSTVNELHPEPGGQGGGQHTNERNQQVTMTAQCGEIRGESRMMTCQSLATETGDGQHFHEQRGGA